MAKAIIAMSGGVDSAAAALLTKQAGYDITGVTLHLHDKQGCGAGGDANTAAAVCKRIGVPHETWNADTLFREKVMDAFAHSYLQGATPNPCIRCNRWLKFGYLMDEALKRGAETVVTGHYARIERREDGRFLLKKARDLKKDQTYVLYSLTQEQLSHISMPLGEYTKDEVRALAKEHQFESADVEESQDICFIPDGAYAKFIWDHTGHQPEPGDFIDMDGCIMGRHGGIECYTIGQRRGIGIAGTHPYYVVAKNAERNTVMLGEDEDLYRDELYAGEVNWIPFDKPEEPLRCSARTRYHQQETPCTVYAQGDRVRVQFDTPIRAIAKGQSVVFYDGDLVLGGGTIL